MKESKRYPMGFEPTARRGKGVKSGLKSTILFMTTPPFELA
jgi:hypothetical protein